MKSRISKVVTSTLKQIKPDVIIYADSVMQSDKDFYIVLSLEEGGTENAGINVQNTSFLVDIVFVDNQSTKESKKMIEDLLAQCGSFFNVLEIEGNQIFPENYLLYKSDGIQHIGFTVAFPQYIEWSEINGDEKNK